MLGPLRKRAGPGGRGISDLKKLKIKTLKGIFLSFSSLTDVITIYKKKSEPKDISFESGPLRKKTFFSNVPTVIKLEGGGGVGPLKKEFFFAISLKKRDNFPQITQFRRIENIGQVQIV